MPLHGAMKAPLRDNQKKILSRLRHVRSTKKEFMKIGGLIWITAD
jgi:hypothetical protein